MRPNKFFFVSSWKYIALSSILFGREYIYICICFHNNSISYRLVKKRSLLSNARDAYVSSCKDASIFTVSQHNRVPSSSRSGNTEEAPTFRITSLEASLGIHPESVSHLALITSLKNATLHDVKSQWTCRLHTSRHRESREKHIFVAPESPSFVKRDGQARDETKGGAAGITISEKLGKQNYGNIFSLAREFFACELRAIRPDDAVMRRECES